MSPPYELYCPIVFAAECILNVVLNSNTMAAIQARILWTLGSSVITEVLCWTSLTLIGKFSDWDIYIIISAGCGAVVGDGLTAWWRQHHRKIKRSTKKRVRKVPCTTA